MVIGDPYTFSVFAQVIDSWNQDDTFRNGILIICIDGILYPQEVFTATLKYDAWYLQNNLKNIPVTTNLFEQPKNQLFIELYNQDYCGKNDYRFGIAPPVLTDHNCYIFAVSDGKNIRILASKLKYIKETGMHDLKNIQIHEAYVTSENINEIVTKLNLVIE